MCPYNQITTCALKFLLILCCLCSTSYINAQSYSINQNQVFNDIKVLSSDNMQGRFTGSEGERNAAEYIANRFDQIGLLPYDSKFILPFELEKVYWDEVYIEAQGRRLDNFEQMVFIGYNAENEEVEKELIFGGTGTSLELSKLIVKDKLVLLFLDNMRAAYPIINILKKSGAYGVILANPNNEAQFNSMLRGFQDHILQPRFYLPSTKSSLDTLTFINQFIIPNDYIKTVANASIGYLKKLVKSKRIDQFEPVKIKIKCEKKVVALTANNVAGYIKGSHHKSIVISAHYDHLGQTEDNIYYGADDNAAGIAGILEIAKAFSYRKDLPYNMIFVAFSAEEQGLRGSKFFVEEYAMDTTHIQVNFNLDMISRIDHLHKESKSDYLYCVGTERYPNYIKLFQFADSLYKDCSFEFSHNNIYSRSDQYSFSNQGIPSFMFFSGFHADYHQYSDTYDKIDPESLASRLQLIYHVIDAMQTDSYISEFRD